MAARDASMPFEETRKVVEDALAAVPGGRVVSLDSHSGIAVVEIPGSHIDTVRGALGPRFFFDPNAPLKY